MEQLVCWQCEDIGHIRRNYQQGCPRKHSLGEKDRPNLEVLLEEMDKEMMVSSLLPPCYVGQHVG
jgi:hypothetical protein